jgi:lipoate-protein ligase B
VARGLLLRTEVIGYREAWELQERWAAARARGELPDVIWLLEHPPVFTVGRHGRRADLVLADDALAASGASFVATDRGGQMTWHGPGQSVGYAICDLRPGRRVHGFVDALVSAMRDAAGVAGASAGDDAMGLYVAGRKLGSVGIRVRSGITSHGLALNRDPDLDWFRVMTACGAPDVEATSIAREGGDPDRARVEAALAASLSEGLGLDLEEVALADLVDQGRSDSQATSAADTRSASPGSAPASDTAAARASGSSSKGSASGSAARNRAASSSDPGGTGELRTG